jgi:hypothetical protein
MTKAEIKLRLKELEAKAKFIEDSWEEYHCKMSKLKNDYPKITRKSIIDYVDSLKLPALIEISFEETTQWELPTIMLKAKFSETEVYVKKSLPSSAAFLKTEGLWGSDWMKSADNLEFVASMLREFSKINWDTVDSLWNAPISLPDEPTCSKALSYQERQEMRELREELRILRIGFKEGAKVEYNMKKRVNGNDEWRPVTIEKIYDDNTFKGTVHYLGHDEKLKKTIDWAKLRKHEVFSSDYATC